MMRYLSFGGGVNSVALYLLLMQQGMEPGNDFEAVYADHGSDTPATRAYIDGMIERGFPVTLLEARRDGLPLYEYYYSKAIIPVRITRSCSDHFKVRPLQKYYAAHNPDWEGYLGIAAEEAHRARGTSGHLSAPLVEAGIDRTGCVALIQAAGWPVPEKSGCYYCPFQTVGQWEILPRRWPDLYQKALALEDNSNARIAGMGGNPFYLAGEMPLAVFVAGAESRRQWKLRDRKCQERRDGQLDMFDADVTLEQCPYCML